MKRISHILFFLILSASLYPKGEISFAKQKEKIKREQQEQQEPMENRQTESNSKKRTATDKERAIRRAILDTAFSKMGTPYIYGANGNGAYDCSSYVQYVYKKSLNVNLPRVSYQQAEAGQKASLKQLKAGDLVVFDTLGQSRISHVGIYLGNNQFIHASSGYKKVVISELEGYYAQKFRYGVKII